MGAFLSVGKGSSEPSVFLEMKYSGAKESDSPPLILVGKGDCLFDFSGIRNQHDIYTVLNRTLPGK